MTTPIYGLTPEGFNTPRLANVKQFLENDFIAALGDVNLDPQSVIGQLIGIFSKSYADQWENLEDVYLSQYPNSAAGVSLDNVVQLNGITRLPATQTSVTATCNGIQGTFIPQNSLARIPTTGDTFYANVGGTITAESANIVTVMVQALAAQVYNIILNNSVFSYSLPVITFSNSGAIFVSSNSIVLTLNGIKQTAIPFTTDSDTTLGLIAAQIASFIASTTATPTNPNIITITPPSGYNITINSISITGGASQASYAITYLAPANNNDLTSAIVAILNQNTPVWTAIDNMDGTFAINANVVSTPFSCSVGTNLIVTNVSSPINFLAQNYGPIPCPVNTLTFIVTAIAGWNSVNNSVAGNTGTLIETDAQLRIRRQNSIKLLGSATVEAITAGILQNVAGVTSCTVFENTSLQQTEIDIVFPLAFQSGDIITNTVEGMAPFTVTFNTNQVTTMALLVTAYEALPAVKSASYGGTGNQQLSITVNVANTIFVTSVITSVTDQTATINGGRPPKSFEAVVEGGADYEVADQIWKTKPAGIETFGNVNNGEGIAIIDSQGNTQTIYFSRPTPIYIWVQVALTLYTQETFPSGGVQLVAQSIFNYGESLGVGIDVLLQRVLAQIFTVSGIASGDMTIAATNSLEDSPSFSTSDITIEDNQVSIWDLTRISVTVS